MNKTEKTFVDWLTLAKAEKEIKGLAGRLSNPNFADKAPPEVVAECKAKLAEAEVQADWRADGWRIWDESWLSSRGE